MPVDYRVDIKSSRICNGKVLTESISRQKSTAMELSSPGGPEREEKMWSKYFLWRRLHICRLWPLKVSLLRSFLASDSSQMACEKVMGSVKLLGQWRQGWTPACWCCGVWDGSASQIPQKYLVCVSLSSQDSCLVAPGLQGPGGTERHGPHSSRE